MSIGLGGGILWVPLLLWVFGLSPQEAVATSLVIQVVGLGSGSFAYIKSRMVNFRLVGTIILAALPAVIAGSLLAVSLPKAMVQGTLGIMSLAIALIFVSAKEAVETQAAYKYDLKKVSGILPIPAFFGFFSGFLSVGIGEWLIPSLKTRLNMNMYRAVANVVVVMFVLAITGAVTHGVVSENIKWQLVIWGALGVVIGAQVGPRIARRINDRALKEVFIYIMTLIGIHEIFLAL
jgi:hypothetical protein